MVYKQDERIHFKAITIKAVHFLSRMKEQRKTVYGAMNHIDFGNAVDSKRKTLTKDGRSPRKIGFVFVAYLEAIKERNAEIQGFVELMDARRLTTDCYIKGEKKRREKR